MVLDKKFERTKSSPCLSMTTNRLDDSILQVVEMELKRMRSSELKPKVCTKLFPRHSSDPSIIGSSIDINSSDPELHIRSSTMDQPLESTVNSDSEIVLPVVSKENLVNQSSKIDTSVRTVRINVPLELKIAPLTMKQCTTPKFVKLTKFDMKKLVPISKEDIKIKLPSASPTVSSLTPIKKSNITYLTKIPTKKISPGDTFKAIKVGNTFQLVPIERKSDKN